jgi:uncharacterized membrane protein YfcA
MISSIDLLYAFSGFCVSLLVGMTGVGGGSLMTPLLILLFGIHPATAVGTDLLYAAATKSAGTLVHGLNRSIDWRLVGRLAAGSVPASGFTLLALSRFGFDSGIAQGLITTVLSGALAATAAVLIFRKRILALWAGSIGELRGRSKAALTVVIGAALGIMVSISSVGAGAIGVTAVMLLYPRLPTARIVGSDIAHAVPLTLLAGIGHWTLGSIDWHLLGALLAGALPGIVIGSYVSVRGPRQCCASPLRQRFSSSPAASSRSGQRPLARRRPQSAIASKSTRLCNLQRISSWNLVWVVIHLPPAHRLQHVPNQPAAGPATPDNTGEKQARGLRSSRPPRLVSRSPAACPAQALASPGKGGALGARSPILPRLLRLS